MKTDLSKYNNSDYNPGGSLFKRITWYFINLTILRNGLIPFSGLKKTILRAYGAKIGKGVNIKPYVNIKYPWFLEIGDNVWIGENTWIDNLDKVSIRDNVCLSQGAMLLTGNHNYKRVSFELMVGRILLEDGVWIGAKAVVCPGVICHSHAVLSVGSIATSDLDPYFIYSGNPAGKIKRRVIED